MTLLPETRESLLLMVRDPANTGAWEQFAGLYRPVAYRLARRRGLQDADAEDLAQQVLLAVSKAIRGWEKDPERGTFRAWLVCVTRNAITNALTRRAPDRGSGSTSIRQHLDGTPDEAEDITALIEDEHERAVFRWAADRVRVEFQETTWLAFWRSAIDGATIDEVASELGKTVGAVYAARSRVMRRLSEEIQAFQW